MEKKFDFPTHTNYEIKNQLGKGGFGSVYKVLNKDDSQFYVIKKIPIKGLNNIEIDKIKNEAKILASIENENIVKYYDSFIDNDEFNIVMEYCEALDLRNLISYMKELGEFMDESIIYYFIKKYVMVSKKYIKKI